MFQTSKLTTKTTPHATYPTLVAPAPRATCVLQGDYWQVLKRLSFTFEVGSSEGRVEVPAGFLVLRDALPWSLRWIAPMWRSHSKASILYQYLVEVGHVQVDGTPVWLTRRQIHNAVLGSIGIDLNIPAWKCVVTMMHFAWLARKRFYRPAPNPDKLFFEINYEQSLLKKKVAK